MRFAKYLVGKEPVICRFDYQKENKYIDVRTDNDYEGCRETRKSTSGGLIQLGKHLIRTWSSTQKVIALSSGEAEYYGMLKGGAEAMGTGSTLQDMDLDRQTRLSEDSTAAKGIAERTGLGKVGHIEVNQLWIQGTVRNKEIKMVKVKGIDNL